MKIELGLVIEDKSWKVNKFSKKQEILTVVKKTLQLFPALKKTTVELAVLLTDNEKMRQLNSEFRGKNKPTNVLSFPDKVINKKHLLEFLPNKEYIYVGDIALGYEIMESEATELKVSMYEHFAHLLVHGILHLLSYDHQSEKDAQEMIALEVKILKELGIESPYL